jgi:hypothetical protein
MEARFPQGPFRNGTLTIEGAFLMRSEIPDGIEIRDLFEIMIRTQRREHLVEWKNEMESEYNIYVGLDRDADKASQDVLYPRLGSLKTRHGGYNADSCIGLILEEKIDETLQPCFKRIGRWEHFMKEEDMIAQWAKAQRKTFRIL